MTNQARQSQLLGCWEIVHTNPTTVFGDRVQMEFAPSGALTYASLEGGKWQIMFLSYRAEGQTLITNQTSAPREEKTAFTLLPSGELELEFGGVVCTLRRVPQPAFGAGLKGARQ
jgi:hypothetical protein